LKYLFLGDEDSEEIDEMYSDFSASSPSVNTRIIQTVPAKEPKLDAVPIKSALKKPLSVQEKRNEAETYNKFFDSSSRLVRTVVFDIKSKFLFSYRTISKGMT
jgi:hypothetical protein